MTLHKAKSVYCAGIGGIGISALARWLHSDGKKVFGSDAADSENTQQLRKEGISVDIGKEELPEDFDMLLYSPAIPATHPLRQSAASRNIPALSYPEALAEMAQEYTVIAIAGTHGKTSTTTFLGALLEAGGLDPVVVVGSRVKNWNGNFRAGNGKYLVLEADEFNRSFLNYHPAISIVTNIEHDHVDTYANLEDVLEAFSQFLKQTESAYYLNADDPGIQKLPEAILQRASWYSLNELKGKTEPGDANNTSALSLPHIGELHIPLPGEHMLSNALAAITVAKSLKVSDDAIKLAFSRLQGIERRFEHLGIYNSAPVYSDYAHHPTEVLATLKAAKQAFPQKNILAIFQPHQQARLDAFGKQFVESLLPADQIILYHTYEVLGREAAAKQKFTLLDLEEGLRQASKDVKRCETADELTQELSRLVHKEYLVLFLGAGTIHGIAKKIVLS